MPAPDDDTPQPSLPLLGAEAEPCVECGAPLAADQRYCLGCGRRRGPARLDPLAAARRRARVPRTVIHAAVPADGAAVGARGGRLRPPVSPRLGATLCLAMLVGGIALGAAAGPDAPASIAAGGRKVIAIVGPPAVAPAALAASPSPSPDAGADGGDATADDGAGTDDAGVVDDGAGATDDTGTTDDTATDTGTAPADPDTGDAGDGTDDGPDTSVTTPPSPLPPVKHVWFVSLTGQRYAETWSPKATDPTLRALAARGTVLSRLFSVAHGTLPAGIALLSGQGPNPATQAGCATPSLVTPGTVAEPDKDPLQQLAGTGCLYPATVSTLPGQLDGAGLTWKAYVESIASPDPNGPQTCRHGEPDAADPFATPRAGDPYLTPRNPFVYLQAISADAVCGTNVVGLDRLTPDLAAPDQTPTFSYVIPNACHDGNPVPCAPGAPAGLAAASPWLQGVVDQITATDAYKDGGLIIVAADQTPADPAAAGGIPIDPRGCRCDPDAADGKPFWPNTTDAGAPAPAPAPADASAKAVRAPRGGGRVGALLLSPYVTPGRVIGQQYDQVSLLKSIEDLFGLPHLGAAADAGHKPLAEGAYGAYTPPRGASR